MEKIPLKKLKNDFLAFEGIGSHYLFQTKTFNIYKIDAAVFKLLEQAGSGKHRINLKDFPGDIKALLVQDEEISAEKDMLEALRKKYMQPPESLTSLNIYLSSRCNLRCRYCYTDKTLNGTIDAETAFRAVDFYLKKLKGSEKPVSINFFGGEPLLEFKLIKKIVEYAKYHSDSGGRRISFYTTTNGTLLDPEKISYLQKNNFELVVSIDGDKDIHDRNRRTRNGAGTYDRIRKNLLLLSETHQEMVRLRATITPCHTDVRPLVAHLRETGIDRTGFELMYESVGQDDLIWSPEKIREYASGFNGYIKSIYSGIKTGTISEGELSFISAELGRIKHRVYRNTACQMGRESITVAPDGYFYPCHWLISHPCWRIGSPADGLAPDINRSYPPLVFDNPECSKCWARFLCGGGCPAVSYCNNRSLTIPDKIVCADRKIRWTGILMLYAELLSTGDPILSRL